MINDSYTVNYQEFRRGGFGKVYFGHLTKDESQKVAIKVFEVGSSSKLEEAKRELKMCKEIMMNPSLQFDTNLLKVLRVDLFHRSMRVDKPTLVMEKLDGDDLLER